MSARGSERGARDEAPAHPELSTLHLDGQRLYLPSDLLVDALLDEPVLAGRPLGVGRLFSQFVAVARQTPGVRVAFGDAGEPGKPFILSHVVTVQGAPRRVVLEGQTCFACGWRGMTGNARDLALYEGCPDPLDRVQAAMREPSLPCPSCGATLTRACIWVHTVADGSR
ncbi:MAG: hypothetical protein R3B40_04685 [Polyangiales bacterium]|nr:hypothetical protein [Myxococcales bacterium]MCB9662140.1 hypothetical protein [Sandaracinaceae bacterium]